jgi:hypothetical protein
MKIGLGLANNLILAASAAVDLNRKARCQEPGH